MTGTNADRAIGRMLDKATAIHLERARLQGVLDALAEVAGFPATIAALRTEIANLTERAERNGQPSGENI